MLTSADLNTKLRIILSKTSGGSTQGLGGAKPPQITKKEGFSPPKFQEWYIISFAGMVTLTELTGSAVATRSSYFQLRRLGTIRKAVSVLFSPLLYIPLSAPRSTIIILC